jgi:hypothetical protein
MRRFSPQQIVNAYKQKGYELDERPFAMNIFGVRSKNTQSGKFDDTLGYIYKNGSGAWEIWQAPATTDTGTYWLKNIWPGQQGSAILAEGQYKGAYQLGTHYSYRALVQTGGPVTIYRDYNRDAILDFNPGTKQSGFFGINIHRANRVGKTEVIADHSAGCQVFQNVDDFNSFLAFAEKAAARYGNRFTYTLFDERQAARTALGSALRVGALFAASVWAFFSLRRKQSF